MQRGCIESTFVVVWDKRPVWLEQSMKGEWAGVYKPSQGVGFHTQVQWVTTRELQQRDDMV